MKLFFKKFSHPLFGLMIAAGTVLLSYGLVIAQSKAVKSARQEVISSIDKLSEIKSQELTLGEKLLKETELKKIALAKIIDLSILETQELRTKIENLQGVETEFLILRDGFLQKIEDYLDYFLVIGNILTGTNELEAIQKIAGDFKAWRETYYNSEIGKIVDFILVFQNKKALTTADQRFAKIAAELRKFSPLKLQPEIWQPLLIEAALNLKEARSSNNQALLLLSAYTPKDGSSESALTEAASNEIADQNFENDLIIKDLIENSFFNIKEAYQNFIEIAETIKKLS